MPGFPWILASSLVIDEAVLTAFDAAVAAVVFRYFRWILNTYLRQSKRRRWNFQSPEITSSPLEISSTFPKNTENKAAHQLLGAL
jgi:hypothetical protein